MNIISVGTAKTYDLITAASGCTATGFVVEGNQGILSATPTTLSYTTRSTFFWIGETDSDWNKTTNWNPAGIPGRPDIAVISGEAPRFPVLTSTVTVGEIHFEPGAELGSQSRLRGKAFVNYDFSDTDKRNNGLMLSIPLGQVYAGDFSFGGYPLTWVRTFSYEEEGTVTKGVWKTAQRQENAFSYGDAFVLFMEKTGLSHDTRGLSNNWNGDILELPYFENNKLRSETNFAHDFERNESVDVIGTSTFHYFELNAAKTAYEVNDSYEDKKPYNAIRKNSAYQLSVTVNIELNTDFHKGGKFALIGNPYMAALDFKKFHEENQDIIKPNYRIWTESSGDYDYITYSLSGGGTGINQYIAPLQGFMVERKEDLAYSPDVPITLKFNEEMAEANTGATLRSALNQGNKLDIVAGNPIAQNRTFIAEREGGQVEFGNMDARRIINDINGAPKIYTLKPYRNGRIAAAFSIINDADQIIPLGLATSYSGDITFSFTGMDSYDTHLVLIDAVTNKEHSLTGMASFDYTFNYTPKKNEKGEPEVCEDRFFIRISKTVTDIPKTLVAEKVNVFVSNRMIQVVSGASNPIKEVAVYDMRGALIYKANALRTISHTVERSWPAGAYIVRVVSEMGVDNVKVIKR